MAAGWVLAVDLGTSGLKVGAVAETGEILGSRQAEIKTTFTDDGGVEQDPAPWWAEICAASHALLASGAAVDAADLVAVGITGQYASTVPVDAAGAAVGPCLTWADDRGGRHSKAAFGGIAAGYKPTAIAPWLRYTGGVPSPGGADPSGHALFLKHDRPETYARTAVLLEPLDYLGLRFTGRAGRDAGVDGGVVADRQPGRGEAAVRTLARPPRGP